MLKSEYKMRTALALAVLLGVMFGLVEMGALPSQTGLNNLDILQRTRRSPPKGPCTPGEAWPDPCNRCWCLPSGEGYACTRRACLPNVERPTEPIETQEEDLTRDKREVCTPGEMVTKNCNTCVCNKLGTELACTRMQCPSNWPNDIEQGPRVPDSWRRT